MGASPELLTGLGAATAMFLTAAGSAYATIHTGLFALHNRQGIIKSFAPVAVAGVLSIYGIIVAVLLTGKIGKEDAALTEIDGYRNISSGLAVGLACLCSGLGQGLFIKHARRPCTASSDQRSETEPMTEPLIATAPTGDAPDGGSSYTHLILVMVFMEAIGLYGLIVALFLMSQP